MPSQSPHSAPDTPVTLADITRARLCIEPLSFLLTATEDTEVCFLLLRAEEHLGANQASEARTCLTQANTLLDKARQRASGRA